MEKSKKVVTPVAKKKVITKKITKKNSKPVQVDLEDSIEAPQDIFKSESELVAQGISKIDENAVPMDETLPKSLEYLDTQSDAAKAVEEAAAENGKSIEKVVQMGDTPWKLIGMFRDDNRGLFHATTAMAVGTRGVIVKVSERDGGKNDTSLIFIQGAKIVPDTKDNELFKVL